MILNESIVEEAALEWFGELGYAVGHGPHLARGEYAKGTLIPAFSQREKEKEKEREAIRRLNPANACGNPHPASPKGRGEETRATVRKFRIVHIERRPNP